MASDATVVRLTAPWPGVASSVVEALATLVGGGDCARIAAVAGVWWHPADLAPVLQALASAGVCARQGDAWIPTRPPAELSRIAAMLHGAALYKDQRHEATRVEVAISMPLAPSFLAAVLGDRDGRPGGFLTTAEAFAQVARAAEQRLVVMSPFIDRGGFRWAREIFERNEGRARDRILMIRDLEEHMPSVAAEHREWILDLGIDLRDYNVGHSLRSSRKLPRETFHAKILVADRGMAYVGSANLLGAPDEAALETGVILQGPAASRLADLAEAVLLAAKGQVEPA